MMQAISTTRCTLGEGAFWHPRQQQFYWFDILEKRLYTLEAGTERFWQFDECVSALGWVDGTRFILASASGLWLFDSETGDKSLLVALEADNPQTRSNDGRADPWGGFWIGTMGYNAERGAGAIYRYFQGALRKLVPDVTISNAICFAPDRSCAYYTDTHLGLIMRQPLDPQDGWPMGRPQVFLDLSDEDFGPDGAVVDQDGNLWNAQWGAARVAAYAPDGTFEAEIPVPTPQVSCPAFGGPDLSTLFVTTAADGGLPAPAGQTFATETLAQGQAEHQVIL
ncbi:SMP-30/gluconolactonase/LRE family protein [Epibacterium sp. SM1979]|uniref:SMP-30/gluconolactonase/LRE family protein n=1 Tax=Tritonibacter litoralis TaxID=2662264 RepID=A0A843YLP7_9RHOB|nr:SMP-30/gluconolactonase/LRE family protein [Tritonibacter litoralis]MQQ10172.1 SMP-30/gluconolactonase/LRE family protein [Tritonibacter litoralis]